MILKLVNPLESLEDRIAIQINRFLRAFLVFSSSSRKQRSMALPSFLHVPGGRVYLGLWRIRPGKQLVVVPYQSFL